MHLRHSIAFACALILATASTAGATTGFSAALTGSQEFPANASPGTGTGFFVLDNSGTTLTWNVTFSGLVAGVTASHIHAAACPGANASVQLPLNPPLGVTSGSFSGSGAVNATLLAALMSSCSGGSTMAYINIHTNAFPGGEIRGQLTLDVTPTRPSTWGRVKQLYR